MAKKRKTTFQFLFSTTDLTFDPSTVQVIDERTGKELKIDSTIQTVEKQRTKVFGLRITEDELKRIHRTAKKVKVSPGDFGRRAIERAVREVEDDSKRQKKNK